MKKINLRWAQKVLRSHNFAVVTDTEAAIWLDIKNPRKLTNVVTVQSQRATLKIFVNRLQSLIREHDKAIEKVRLRAKANQGRSKANTATRKGAK